MARLAPMTSICLLGAVYGLFLLMAASQAQHRRFGVKPTASSPSSSSSTSTTGVRRKKSPFEILNSQFAAENDEIDAIKSRINNRNPFASSGSTSAPSGDALSDFLDDLGRQSLDGLGMLRRIAGAVQDHVNSEEVRDFFASGAFGDAMQQGAAALDEVEGEEILIPPDTEGADEMRELISNARKQAKDMLQSSTSNHMTVYESLKSYIGLAVGLIDQLQAARTSPRKLRKALAAVPEAAREVAELLTQLDHSTVYSAVVNAVRGLDPSEQAMLSKVVAGDLRGFSGLLKAYLKHDDDKIAQIQSYVSENQDAFSFIPAHVLKDKLMFKVYLMQSLDDISNPKSKQDQPIS